MSKKIEKEKKVDAKAEFIVTMEWPDDSDDDVDMYLEDPLGNLSFFRAREVGLMHLERDDLGSKNDRIILADGSMYEVKENSETLTIRGIIPGEYIVNAHMYLRKDKGDETPIKIKIVKINPTVKIIMVKEFKLGRSGDEMTAFRFVLDKHGEVIDINFLQKDLAKKENQPYSNYGDYGDYGNSYGDGYEEDYIND